MSAELTDDEAAIIELVGSYGARLPYKHSSYGAQRNRHNVVRDIIAILEPRIRERVASEIEAVRDSADHYEHCSLTEAAAIARGAA